MTLIKNIPIDSKIIRLSAITGTQAMKHNIMCLFVCFRFWVNTIWQTSDDSTAIVVQYCHGHGVQSLN